MSTDSLGGVAARHWHRLADGRCQDCGTPCAGVFEGDPGRWGQRRQPLSLERAAIGA